MAFKFVIFVTLIAVGFSWPYERTYYDEPQEYERPYGGYGRPNYGYNQENTYGQHGYGRPTGGYGRPQQGGYARPSGGYGRPTNVDFGGDQGSQQQQNWQGSQQSQGQHQQPRQGQQFHQQPDQGQFESSSNQPNPTSFGDRFDAPTTGNNNPQINVEPADKVAEGVKTFGGSSATTPAPVDPNIDLTGSRVFKDNGDAASPDVATSEAPNSSSNNEGFTGQQESSNANSDQNIPSPPSTGSLFGGSQAGAGTEGDTKASSQNEQVTIDPSATADSSLVLG